MAYRVVFELTEGAAWKVQGVLGSIRHLLEQMGAEGLEVELVAHADGIAALYRTPNREARSIEDLAGQGVRFAACHYTMASRGVTAEDLVDVAQMVPSGIGEIVRRQGEGWLYLPLLTGQPKCRIMPITIVSVKVG